MRVEIVAWGGKRPGAGRKPGDPAKARREKAAAVLSELAGAGCTPLDIFGRMMRGDASVTEPMFEAAKACAPYLHPRLQAITMEATVRRDITELTDEELYALAGPGEGEGTDGDPSEE